MVKISQETRYQLLIDKEPWNTSQSLILNNTSSGSFTFPYVTITTYFCKYILYIMASVVDYFHTYIMFFDAITLTLKRLLDRDFLDGS